MSCHGQLKTRNLGHHSHTEAVCGARTKSKPKTSIRRELSQWDPALQVSSKSDSERAAFLMLFQGGQQHYLFIWESHSGRSGSIKSESRQLTDIFLLVQVAKDQMYPLKLKGISICFSMLKAALCGSYVNFGVFRFPPGFKHDVLMII